MRLKKKYHVAAHVYAEDGGTMFHAGGEDEDWFLPVEAPDPAAIRRPRWWNSRSVEYYRFCSRWEGRAPDGKPVISDYFSFSRRHYERRDIILVEELEAMLQKLPPNDFSYLKSEVAGWRADATTQLIFAPSLIPIRRPVLIGCRVTHIASLGDY
ncbi:MAG: hypothetical protein EXS55_04195 [Candidatus Magasanikbacteria bacterium]|nr:hypothetical protein [Candidatus Magasanikbacteria bacterium]